MCSTEVDDGNILMEKVENLDRLDNACKKCGIGSQAKVVLRKRDAYCKSCFLTNVKHKFRACLGKSKMMKPGDKVLVAFSGTNNSVAMLHLIQAGLEETSHKKLMFHPSVVYIDESVSLPCSREESSVSREHIQQIWTNYTYPKYIVPLHLSIESEELISGYLAGGSPPDEAKFETLLNSLPDNTSKIDLINKLRSNLLILLAKVTCCNKVFTAETANDLAVKLFTNVSLGRGAQLPYDVGFSDQRNGDVKVIRPMRDLSKKELVFYNVFHGLEPAHIPSLVTKAEPYSSIQKLTETFLTELQDGFPSTLSTVFRVADKLTTNPDDKDVCPLCQAPVDTEKVQSSSLNATQFSRIVSYSGPSKLDASSLANTSTSDSECCNGEGSSKGTCSKNSFCNKTSERVMQNLLCYGCNLIVRDADANQFPAEVEKYLQETSQRHKMKKEIEEFLL